MHDVLEHDYCITTMHISIISYCHSRVRYIVRGTDRDTQQYT